MLDSWVQCQTVCPRKFWSLWHGSRSLTRSTALKNIRVVCRGVSPLMMHAMSEAELEALRTKVALQVAYDRPATVVAQERLYCNVLNGGEIGLPTENLLAALVNAGRSVKLTGRSKVSTAKTTEIYSFMALQESFLPLRVVDTDGNIRNGEEPKWVVDKRRGVLHNKGEQTTVCITRPKFAEWGFVVTVEFDDTVVNEGTVRQLFDKAGTSQGLCSFRPSCKGPFGRFKVVKWELLGA